MAPRNPAKVQLDFPQLTADLISQLRLTGTVGLIDFLDAVRPVYIVASREGALAFTASQPLFTSAGVSSGFAVNPLANAVIADSGPLPAGDYDIFASMSMNGNLTATGHIELQHRNAANAATLAVLLDMSGGGVPNDIHADIPALGYTLALNERLRFQLLLGNMTGGVSANVGVQIRPTP